MKENRHKLLNNSVLKNVIKYMKGIDLSVSLDCFNEFEHEYVTGWVEKEDESRRIDIEFYIKGYYSDKRAEYIIEEFEINKAWIYDDYNDEVYLTKEQREELRDAVQMFICLEESLCKHPHFGDYKIRKNKYSKIA